MLLGEQGGLGSSPDFPPRKAPGRSPGPAVPNLFLASGTGFVEDDFSTHWGRVGSGFQDDSRVLHLLCTLFLFLLHQFHLSSSSIRFQRLGTPGLNRNLLSHSSRG